MTPTRAGLAVAGLFALGAAVRALRFWSPHVSWAHWDDVRLAIPAVHILGGALPVHHLGVEYMGASPSYPLAAWFALAGYSTLALDLFAYGVGLAILWTAYLVARRLLEPFAALVALALLAAPPLVLARWSLTGNLNHPVLLVIGNLVLLGTHTLFFRRPGRAPTIFVLGLLVGVGWWTNPLILVYLPFLGLLALRTGLVWRPRAWLFPIGALMGSLPAWIYEARYFPSTRFVLHEGGSVPVAPLWERVGAVGGRFFPELLGIGPHQLERPAVAIAGLGVLLLGAVAVVRAATRDRGELLWVVGLRRQPSGGGSILWGLLVSNVAAVIATQRTTDTYYLLALHVVMACWIGDTLGWLWHLRRALGGTVLAALLGFQLWANSADTTFGGVHHAARRWVEQETELATLVPWLEARGFTRVYWGEVATLASFEFTYLTGMRIIAADLWREPALQHARLVDAAVAPPIVTRRNVEALRASLRGIGMAVRETPVGRFVVMESTPAFSGAFTPLPPEGWTVTARDNTELVTNLVDRDAATGWNPGSPQSPGQWLRVDLGREELVARLDLLAIDWNDVPSAFRVEASRDGTRWNEIVSVREYWGPLFFSEHHPFLKIRRGRVQAIFPPVRTRFLRIVHVGASPVHSWGARELFVYGPGGPAPTLPRPGEITAALRREGVRFVYANHWLSAWVQIESAGSVGADDSNSDTNSNGRLGPDPTNLKRLRIGRGRAILVGSGADAGAIRALLDQRGIVVRDAAAGPYRLLVLGRSRDRFGRLSKDGFTAVASEHPARARLAADGDRNTRWTSTEPAGSGSSLRLDLGARRRLRRVHLWPGPPDGTRDLRLEGSVDGVRWTPLGPFSWSGWLYWSGSELLRDGRDGWAVTFPPVEIRYLRASPAAGWRGGSWAIAEIDAFE